MTDTLIVEDNAFFRQTLRAILAKKFPSMTIKEASDGQEALLEIEISPPQLIFMDIRLPGENGIELTRKIQAAYPATVIIVISNCDTIEYREAALEAGAKAFISKASSSSVDIMEMVIKLFPTCHTVSASP